MKHYYKDMAMQLFENGYFPIPIKPRSKIPFMSKGESWQVEINREQVQEWQENGKGKGGVALTGLCAIDFDIYDKDVSNVMLSFCRKNLDNMLVRIGQKPKFLFVLSEKSAIKKKWKNTWYDQEGQKHEIEFLAPGNQYFLVYGTHPDTGADFTWLDGYEVLSTPVDRLPSLDSLDISMIEDEFERIAQEKGWVKGKAGDTRAVSQGKDGGDPLENLKVSGEMSDPAGLAELSTWVGYLSRDYRDDYDLWISIAAAIHHETAGGNEGWSIFDSWSKSSTKYKGRVDTIAKWESFNTEKGAVDGAKCSSRGTIIHFLKECGKWPAAQKAGEEARNDFETIHSDAAASKKSSDIIHELNSKHAIVSIGGKIRVMTTEKDYTGDLDLQFSSVQDFGVMYANKFAKNPKDPKKNKTVAKIWLESPDRREYKGIVFEPALKEVPGYYNLWTGFAVSPRPGDWSRYRGHIEDVVADGNATIARYILAWMARLIQEPGGRRPGTSIVLRGGQGTGKGVFVNIFGDLFGQHFLPVSHASQIAGRFNGHLKNKLLVFIDEGFWAGDKAAEGVLKSIITEPWFAIEQKNQDTIRVRNHVSLMMASNNEWVVPANKGERRFHVLDIPDTMQGKYAYFQKILDQMHNKGGLQAMLFDLLKEDFSDVNLQKFENTKGLFEQKIHTMSTEMQYWYERLQDGRLLSYHENDFNDFGSSVQDDWLEVGSTEQHDDYLRHTEKMKERFPKTQTEFGIFLKTINPWVRRYKKRIGANLQWWRRFPQLSECRAEFETQIKTKIEWDKDDDLDEPDLF